MQLMKLDLSQQYGFSALQATVSIPLAEQSLEALKRLNSKIGGEAGPIPDPEPEAALV